MKKENKIKLNSLIKEIGFRDKASKSVDDVTADKFEDFGVTVGQLYQTFLKKDISADPAVAQKIMNMVDTDDDNVLMNQIKDLEFLINQLPDKIGKKDKIGFKETAYRPKGEDPDKGAQLKTSNMHELVSNPELIDIISHNLAMSDDSEIKKYAQDTFGIVLQDFGEDADALRNEIENILVNSSDEEIKEYFKRYFGAYADEIAQDAGLSLKEDDRSEKDKAFDLAQQLSKLTQDDKIKLKKIVQLMAKEKNEEKINGFDYHYTKGTSGNTHQFGRPRMVNEEKEISKKGPFKQKGTPGTRAKKLDKMDLLNDPEFQKYDDTLASTQPDDSKKDKNLKKAKSKNVKDIDWSKASDKDIRAIGGDVYYGSGKSKNPIKGKQRMLVPPKGGWPSKKNNIKETLKKRAGIIK